MLLVVVAMYFILIRPQRKREKEAQNMRNNLQVGDEVTTSGGIVGRVVSLREDTVDARQADYSRCALAIGSEGRGLSREVLDLCDKTVLIPMSPRCESLNAAIAAAVLLWESWR